ncbi:glycerophosphoinositol inositolphosphodiesterase GDPD2 [Brachyhypopomus gauderio]|uniref:glycerophosphoinositol inositolphosphodiesterase GDPD2 n=1 Tax=Brachyhypopomus gauderio TaxID=698409 RepID=UPI004042BDC9
MCSRNVLHVCVRGTYSCSCERSEGSKHRCAWCWSIFTGLTSLATVGWLYFCFVAYNDSNGFNGKAFDALRVWVNWYNGCLILSAVLALYCLMLLLLSLLLFAIKEPLDLHCLHKVLLTVGLVIVALGIAAVCRFWTEEWKVVRLSLQATGPFLHLAAVTALTIISWLVFQKCHRAQRSVSKILIIVAFIAVIIMVFLSPLTIKSACICDKLPPKPGLVAHRGAPVLAPENTMMSFSKSVGCGVVAFETDVQLSKDMVPFLMHDSGTQFLQRTTNVEAVFPNRTFDSSRDITWKELQELNAGGWFVKTDPFWSVSSLSEEEKTAAQNQMIPSFTHLLELSNKHNIPLIFDLKNDQHGSCGDVVKTIQDSGISQHLIWWLHSTHRECSKKEYPDFQHVYADRTSMDSDGGSWLNMQFSELSTEEISDLRSSNVTVNLWTVNERWLFSLLWCAGVTSVTTNTCHVLKDMTQPDWHLTPLVYRVIWITADLVSLVLMSIIFIFQRKTQARSHIFLLESERRIPLLSI